MTKHITQASLIKAYKKRGIPESRMTMLLEFYLILHFDPDSGSTTTSRKAISDYTGWVYKSVTKAIESLKAEGKWSVIENGSRTIVFIPEFI